MDAGALCALASSRPPPHGRGGLFLFGIVEAPAAWDAWGLPRWGPPWPLPHGRAGLFHFGIIEAPAA